MTKVGLLCGFYISCGMQQQKEDLHGQKLYLWLCYRTDYQTLQLGDESAREQAQREERRIFERRMEGMVSQVAWWGAAKSALPQPHLQPKFLNEEATTAVAYLSLKVFRGYMVSGIVPPM